MYATDYPFEKQGEAVGLIKAMPLSVMDAYLGWVFGRVEDTVFPTADYPKFADHNRRLAMRPAFQSALAIEEANAVLAAEGLVFTSPIIPA